MKKVNKKLAVALLALTCASCATVAGVAVDNVAIPSAITAKAETVRTITKTGATSSSSAKAIFIYAVEGDETGSGNWDDKFTFVEGTGAGVGYNGATITEYAMKQPGNDIYFELTQDAVAGDKLTLDGTFYSQALDSKIVFKNCGLEFDGTKWNTYVPVAPATQYNMGGLVLHVNSRVGGAKGDNTVLYLQRADSEAFPILSWEYVFVAKNADGFKVNGVAKNFAGMKSTGDGMYFAFDALSEGDVITISGTYYCEDKNVEYVFEESSFQWTGEGWAVYVMCEQFNLGAIKFSHQGKNGQQVYFKTVDETLVLPIDSWTDPFSYVSGNGITVNGEMISMVNSVKSPEGSFFADLGKEPSEGDVLKVGGVFRCEKQNKEYVITDSEFTWDGTAWVEKAAEPETPVEPEVPEEPDVPVEPEIDYDDCIVGQLFVSDGNNVQIYLKPADDSVSLPVSSWDYAFSYVSGNGITVNDVMISMENSVKSVGGKLFVDLGAEANKGDILKVGGVLRSKDGKVDYVIEDRQFQWTGSEWKVYGEEIVYTDYKLGEMTLNWPSLKAENAKNNQLYLNQESGEALPIQNWDIKFALESGDGVKVNDKAGTLAEIKSTDLGLFLVFAGVEVGDVVIISGTVVLDSEATRYVIEESKFVWNGTTWEKYVVYTTYNVGNVIIGMDSNASAVYFATAEGKNFDNATGWDARFNFVENSGVGVTINGKKINMNDIKVPGTMYVNLQTTAVAGDVLVIGGAFYSVDYAVKYVIAQTKFIFDGEAWLTELQVAKRDAKAALDAYRATFVEDNYYADEWASFDTIVEKGKAKIDSATTAEEVANVQAEIQKSMDDVVTKAEADAIFEGLKSTAASDLAAYKAQADYRDVEWAQIQEIVATASAEIKAAESVTAINTAVDTAKTAIDALKTKAQWEADEAAVATAKAALASYKAEADYRTAEWTAIQTIITEANAAIDSAIGDQTAIDEIVANAKTAMDAIKTKAQWEADEAVVANAKSALDGYKAETDYRAKEWAEIQAIITEAKTAIDGAIGNETAIAEIVNTAKADMDKVLTAADAEAADLAAAKDAAKAEVRAYYGAIDHSKYSEEAEVTLSGFVATAISAIDAATAIADVEAVVAQFKTNIDGVEQIQDSTSGSDSGKTSSGCASVVGGMATVAMAAAAAAALLRKKKED